MRVLISGAGIAGPTLAYWLAHYGIEATIVERAPQLRTGGYVIDFWGCGYDVAERMGLLPEIHRKGYRVREVVVVDSNGKRISGFPASAFSRATKGRYTSLPRGDLAAAIYSALDGNVETLFGDSITAIEQTANAVRVSFDHAVAREFDLVVGADGLHSRVRELVFDPEKSFEKYLGCKVSAFSLEGYQPRDELIYVMYTEVGQQANRFAMRDDRTMFLFIFADQSPDSGDFAAQKDLLRKRFAHSGWECRRILERLGDASDFYFDRVSQIRMYPQQDWSRGRVVLLGDAASCVSLLAGEGSGLAMTAGYILAGELHRARGDYATAFTRYQELFGPFVARKQELAIRFAGWFAPRSHWAMFLRNQGMKLLAVPWIAEKVVGRGVIDNIALPDYVV